MENTFAESGFVSKNGAWGDNDITTNNNDMTTI